MDKQENYPLVSDSSGKKDSEALWVLKLKGIGGYLSAFGAAFFCAGSLASAQALGGYVPAFELNMWRFLVQFMICLPVVGLNKWSLAIRRSDIPHVAVVCALANIFNLTFYEASVFLPVGTVSCLNGTMLLCFTSAVSMCLDRKCLQLHSLVAMALVLVSVVFVTQPEFLFSSGGYTIHPVCPEVRDRNKNNNNSSSSNVMINQTNLDMSRSYWLTLSKEQFNNVHTNESNRNVGWNQSLEFAETSKEFTNANLGFLLATLSGINSATFYTIIHRKLREMNTIILALYISGSGVFSSLICMWLWEKPMFPSHGVCILLLACHACGTSFQGLLVITAPVLLAPEKVSLVLNVQLVFLFIAQYTFLVSVNPGHRNLSEMLGATGIFVGNCIDPLYNLYIKIRQEDSSNSKTG